MAMTTTCDDGDNGIVLPIKGTVTAWDDGALHAVGKHRPIDGSHMPHGTYDSAWDASIAKPPFGMVGKGPCGATRQQCDGFVSGRTFAPMTHRVLL